MTLVRSLEQGTVLLGKYRIESVLGRGGMGVVVRAWHLGLHEEVAIKMLRDDIALADETIARFIREAQAAVRLKSEHIARITDVGTFEDGKPFMVMELLEGQDIGQLLTERGRLQPSLAIDLVIQACEALAEAHSLGIVHRDIKPANLFLTSHPDGSLLLKVLDFGISKAPGGAELSLTQTWSMLGSPAYMSPEQMRSSRDVDARTDVWSLGAVLYEVLEGHMAFPAESFSEMCVMVAMDPPAAMVATPPELAAIVLRCLTKNPDDRYASVAELGRDLARLAREPAKAEMRVDRMSRMLGRGLVRRTPAAGVPQVAPPAEPAPAAIPRTPVPGPRMPGPPAPAGVPYPLAPSAAHVVLRDAPYPLAHSAAHLALRDAPLPSGSAAPAAYSHGPPIMMAMLDASAHGVGYSRSAAASALVTTHVVRRPRDRSRWIIATAAFVALSMATAILVIVARSGHPAAAARPRPEAPGVVRMTAVPGTGATTSSPPEHAAP